MGVAPTRLFRYTVPLRQPLKLRHTTLSTRTGLLLLQTTKDGDGWGEAAPLPGFSRESIDEVIAAARAGQWSRYASLQFAYKSLLRPTHPVSIPLNALLTDGDLPLNAAHAPQLPVLDSWPHRAVKLKVGRAGMLEQEIQLVRKVRQQLRADQTLRLDANRAWSF
ncbi:MAG: hypothetical protein KDB23_24700, partial [Planctomycetales bacterium]|nr:hypothetical protein [Planctomycetales bacterium]